MARRAPGAEELKQAVLRFPPLAGGARLVRLGAGAASELDALSLRCADFMRLTEGREPGPHEGREILAETPPGFPIADKFVLGVRSDDGLFGVADVLRGYPTADVWWIGLLLLAPDARGAGLGRGIVEAVAAWAAGEGALALQLGVQAQNEAGLRFWRRQDFAPIHTREQLNGARRNQVLVMERRLV